MFIREVKVDMDCIFCMIANGEIPSATLYEDDDFRVVMDLGPATKGHSLILPKKHYANLFELPDEEAAKVAPLAKKVGNALMKATGADGIQVVQNNGEAAGQTVFHFHTHLIPAYKEDGPGAKWVPGTLSDTEKEEIPENIKKYL